MSQALEHSLNVLETLLETAFYNQRNQAPEQEGDTEPEEETNYLEMKEETKEEGEVKDEVKDELADQPWDEVPADPYELKDSPCSSMDLDHPPAPGSVDDSAKDATIFFEKRYEVLKTA